MLIFLIVLLTNIVVHDFSLLTKIKIQSLSMSFLKFKEKNYIGTF